MCRCLINPQNLDKLNAIHWHTDLSWLWKFYSYFKTLNIMSKQCWLNCVLINGPFNTLMWWVFYFYRFSFPTFLPHSCLIPNTTIKLAAKLGRMCKVQCTQHAPAICHTCQYSTDVCSIPPNSGNFDQPQLSHTVDSVCLISLSPLIQAARDEITNNHPLKPHQSNGLPGTTIYKRILCERQWAHQLKTPQYLINTSSILGVIAMYT